ncbi:MAG: hypothetical protein RBU29_11930 [bacterium]|jgi:hypothetical protein|nr:hypothetical protein [bacterium]
MNRFIMAFFTVLFTATISLAEFKAAVSYRNVTPSPLLPVSGGIGPSHPTQSQLGELTVRALVLENNGVRTAIVSTDFLGFPAVLGDRVRRQVEGIPPQNILIGATHTHSAPDCYGFPDEEGQLGTDLAYIDSLCKKTAEAINEALHTVQPAEVKIATGNAKGKIAYNYYAERLYDPRCHVIQVQTPQGVPIATLVNYAIHPEVLGANQGVLSPDLIGPLYDRIQAQGGGIGIFMNSAQGGMVTADCRGEDGKDIQTWEECIRIGHLLADEALRIVADVPVQTDPPLACRAKTVEFPIESPIMKQILQLSPLGYQLSPSGKITTTLNLLHLGNAQILTIPGEALPNIGFYLKRKMTGQHNFLFGLTNDAFGYILTKEDYGSFERYNYITRTSLGEETGPIYIEEALRFIQEIPKPPHLD